MIPGEASQPLIRVQTENGLRCVACQCHDYIVVSASARFGSDSAFRHCLFVLHYIHIFLNSYHAEWQKSMQRSLKYCGILLYLSKKFKSLEWRSAIAFSLWNLKLCSRRVKAIPLINLMKIIVASVEPSLFQSLDWTVCSCISPKSFQNSAMVQIKAKKCRNHEKCEVKSWQRIFEI